MYEVTGLPVLDELRFQVYIEIYLIMIRLHMDTNAEGLSKIYTPRKHDSLSSGIDIVLAILALCVLFIPFVQINPVTASRIFFLTDCPISLIGTLSG